MVDKLMDLSDFIESYCTDIDGNPIRLQPWQKALLLELQKQADKKIANGRPR